ncbi:MAG: biotin/lipoate A/B protein ligase family protein [Deltaproteobacteria bacterium]
MKAWRLILDAARSGAENMAKDEAVLSSLDSGLTQTPTLRFYSWLQPTISIGCLQQAGRLVDKGLPVVRRITGGRAVLHDAELTYSITGSLEDRTFGGITETYLLISRCIVEALNDLSIEAAIAPGRVTRGTPANDDCFHCPSRHEVLVSGKKLVGSAQRRLKNAFVQHGSILFDVNKPLYEGVFGPGSSGGVACIRDFSQLSADALISALVKKLGVGLKAKFSPSGLTGSEESMMQGLYRGRYATHEWNSPALHLKDEAGLSGAPST